MKKIRIIIAEDHQLVMEGYKSLLKTVPEFCLVGEAPNGKQLLKILEHTETDIILMDIDMPVLNGIEATQQTLELYPHIKIIAVSMHNRKALQMAMKKAGARGYLIKNSNYEAFIDEIRRVSKGELFFSQEVLSEITTDNVAFDDNQTSDSQFGLLTEREIEILKFIGLGNSNKQIGDKLFISHRTVDVHRTNLMKKLKVHNIAGLIRFAIKNKLV
jgi:DNA-binding NarL/FixJ family response regulator